MARPRRTIVPLEAEATTTRTEIMDGPAPPQPGPVAPVSPEPTPETLQRSPARQRLAAAIERVVAIEAEIREAGAAIEPARRATWDAQRALDDAEEALQSSRPRDAYAPPPVSYSHWGSQAEADDATRRARAAAEAPPISVADAKAAVETAKDTLDSAKRLRQWHEDKLRAAEEKVGLYRMNVGDAVRDVLREDPALLALATESHRVATHAEALRRAFGEATSGETIQPGSPYHGAGTAAWENDDPEGFAPLYAWRAAIEALSSDPDAPLPAP